MRTEVSPTLATLLTGPDRWLLRQPDEFLTPEVLELSARLGVPDGWAPVFLAVRDAAGIALLVPLMRTGARLAALTTPYTCLWAPLFRPGLGEADAREASALAGRWMRRAAVTVLDGMDADDAGGALLREGLTRAGLVTSAFGHFAAWTGDVRGMGPEAYLAGRPGSLRTVLKRKGKRARDAGLVTTIHAGRAALEAIAAYEVVAARSWKPSEPFPGFLRAWMEAACRDGSGWIGLMRQGERPLAAQFWTLRDGQARVHKLVHDDAGVAFSPGTLLTGEVITRLLGTGAVTTLDFGRGDDPYKGSWVSRRVARQGLLVAAPWRAAGAGAIARHAAGRLRALVRQGGAGQDDPQAAGGEHDQADGAAMGQAVTTTGWATGRKQHVQKAVDHVNSPT